jgi:hypothetical protein
MDVRRLVAIETIEEEPVRTRDVFDSWHVEPLDSLILPRTQRQQVFIQQTYLDACGCTPPNEKAQRRRALFLAVRCSALLN